LYDSSGAILSEYGSAFADYPPQYPNVSYGVKFVNNFDEISYFSTPTPNGVNNGAVTGVVEQVDVSVPAGFYENTFQVALSTITPNATIYYTLDGSTPSASNGSVYSAPLTISGTSNLRTIAESAGYLTVPDRTTSYIFIDDVLTQSLDGTAPPGWPTSWGNNLVDYGMDPDVINSEGAQVIKDALLSIPTWSVTTDLDNLFDPTIGIYSNASQRGIAWERPASVELLNPDGTEGFQVNTGLRIKGAYSRRDDNPKHSFKIYMRSEYGDSELNYAVHGNEGVDTFKKLDLRTAQNWSWNFFGSTRTTFVEDELARENLKDLGQPYTRSTWLHLYLNGQYWGIYQTQERHDDNFAASYFGGSPDDYDVIKAAPGINEVVDGNMDAYLRLFDQAAALDLDGSTPNFVNNDAYMKAQGLNPDGTRNLNYEVLLDVDNVIDYMTLQLVHGNRDGPITMYSTPANAGLNNYFTMRNRTGEQGFQFFAHDSEHMYRDVNESRMGPYNHSNFDNGLYFNPQTLHQKLMANADYRMAFADNIQEHFFNGGTLSEQAQIDKLYELAAEIDMAVYAESARWGDAKVANPRTHDTWQAALANLRDNYFPYRNTVMIDQFRNAIIENRDSNGNYTITQPAPLFPSIDAPRYLVDGVLQSGGLIDGGDLLTMTTSGGPIYYTLDGTDPRLPGGGISASAIMYDGSTVETTAVSPGSSWKYHDQGVNLGTAWRGSSFNDASWNSGAAQLGYGDGDETTIVSFGPNANNKHVTTYFRKTFNVASGNYTSALLKLRRDDGAAVYLNGVEIARDNLIPNAAFNTFANPYASDDGNTWHEFSVDPALLVAGNNTLAVEIHQVGLTSSDISFDAEFIVSASANATPIVLNGPTRILARTLTASGTWSAVHDATYFLDSATQNSVRITEISYNPYDPTAAEISAGYDDADDFEFVEITNMHPTGTVNLLNMQLFNGVSFILPDIDLNPGESVVVVEDIDAFEARYGSSVTVAGQWTGGLSNNGETLALIDANAVEVMSVAYNDSDPWYTSTDGVGATLELIAPFGTPQEQLGKFYHWRGSFDVGGTPGQSASIVSGIVINEVLANSGAAQSDSIELYNPTQTAFDIGGWFLSDSGDNPLKFMIPTGTILGAGQYVVFDESDFNPNPSNPGPDDFALSGSEGDQVYLSQASGGTFLGYESFVDFGSTFEGVSLARVPDGSGRLLPSMSTTLGTSNGAARVGPLVISEVNYHPGDPSAAALTAFPSVTATDLEFIEVNNPTLQTVGLTDWRLRGESDFDFPAGTSLGPGGTVVIVSFDPSLPGNAALLAAFRAEYGIGASVPLFGPFLGSLNNSFGRVSLQMPDAPPASNPSFTPHVVVDELVYDDLAPWEVSADGTGVSLTRIAAGVRGTLATNWGAVTPTPGTASMASTVGGRTLVYNNSGFAVGADYATDKTALLTGQTATFANYTSYIHGINNIVLDVIGLSVAPTVNDFEFRVGNNDNPNSWAAAPAPSGITVIPGGGVGGIDRISLTWADGSITNEWLQVQLLANGNTGLAADDIFYFGNAIGETGDNPSNTRVNLIDVGATRANQTGFALATIENNYDFNRDRRVNLIDVGLARVNQTGFTSLALITPGPSSRSAGSGLVGDDKTSTDSVQLNSRLIDFPVSQPVAVQKPSVGVGDVERSPVAENSLLNHLVIGKQLARQYELATVEEDKSRVDDSKLGLNSRLDVQASLLDGLAGASELSGVVGDVESEQRTEPRSSSSLGEKQFVDHKKVDLVFESSDV
jgi:hypothetical protein